MGWEKNNISPHSLSLAAPCKSQKHAERQESCDPAAPSKKIGQVNGLVAVGVLQDAAGAGEAFEGFAMAFGANLGGADNILGLIPAATALKLKNGHAADGSGEGVVSHKLSLG